MGKSGSILSQHLRQKLKRSTDYRKYTFYSNDNMVDFNQFINSKYTYVPVNQAERLDFITKQKETVDLTFLNKTYKKMPLNGKRELSNDNHMIFGNFFFKL